MGAGGIASGKKEGEPFLTRSHAYSTRVQLVFVLAMIMVDDS
jgi:hypothetical protein